MKRIVIFLHLLFACVCGMNSLRAMATENIQEEKNNLRILKLLPNLYIPFAVDPGIPEDFIALTPSGNLDPYDWIYWGPKDVLKAYFEDPTSLKTSILRVRLSTNVSQTSPNSFNHDEIKMLGKEDPTKFAYIETQWGDYPVLASKVRIEEQLMFTAWVGLNDPEAGWTLMFNLVYPLEKGGPKKEDCQLWENLLTKTIALKDRDYFKACGQDLQEGYTLVSVGGAKLKMLAEKRQSDGALQVVVIPDSPEVEFHYAGMMECAMGAKWKFGEPMVKVYGEIVLKKKNFTFTTDSHFATSIFFKTVQDFSFKREDEKELLIFQMSRL
jgi:hypothetical protein